VLAAAPVRSRLGRPQKVFASSSLGAASQTDAPA